MKVQISDIISGKDRSKKVNYTVEIPNVEFEGDIIKFAKPCIVDGMITSDGDILVFKANIKTELEMVCSRCLDTFIYPIDIDIEERYTNDSDFQDEDGEVTFVKDDVLDITEIVESSIISTLPIKRLCKEDCKGLCQSCGANLNKETCSCNNENIDPRLEGLRALLNNKEV